MIKSFYILLLLTSFLSFSQEEQKNYAETSKKFLQNYNNEDYETIFEMFNKDMQKALPKEKTISFFTNNVAPAGKIEEMMFSNIKETIHVYKTTFEKATFDVVISLDSENKISGLLIKPHIPKNLPVLEKNTTKMILPFNEEWTVFWGGTNVEENYHFAYNNQKYAYDLVITKNGESFKNDRSKNENFYVFGKQIIAPCSAEVVKVIKGVKDNVPGILNPKDVSGNTVVLKTANNEFITFAHFKEKSIRVQEGQIVKTGDILGLCGNSGNSSEPHLHLSLQNVKDMNIATGAKMFFDKIMVNGNVKENYIPVKNDKIKNIKK